MTYETLDDARTAWLNSGIVEWEYSRPIDEDEIVTAIYINDYNPSDDGDLLLLLEELGEDPEDYDLAR